MMAWVRLDDGFDRHPKVTALGFRDRWTWIGLLCYAARYDTGGFLPTNIDEHVPGATHRLIVNLTELGLLDTPDGELRIHDWEHYRPKDPTKAERQARWRRKQASTSPSHETHENATDTASTSVPTSRARPPSRPTEASKNDASGKRAPDELWDALAAELGEVTTKTERGQRNGAVKELREVGATAEDVHARCHAYRRKWPEMALTATALKKHWSSLEPRAEITHAHVDEIVNLPEADTAANLEHIREMAGSIGREVA